MPANTTFPPSLPAEGSRVLRPLAMALLRLASSLPVKSANNNSTAHSRRCAAKRPPAIVKIDNYRASKLAPANQKGTPAAAPIPLKMFEPSPN
jgi:hypothetical protein